MLRWWPPVASLTMLLLGWAVGKGSTPLDDWFLRQGFYPWALLILTNWLLQTTVLATAVAVALARKRWRLAAVMALCPPVGIAIARVLKRLFDREKGGALAYPSGHTTALVIVMGMVVLAAGGALWAIGVAVTASLLGMLGLGFTYHYFTDTIGAMLLGTAIVCIAAVLTRPPHLTGVNPGAIWVTTDG